MPDTTPGVKKILNNGGFIAALAPVLAARSHWPGIRESAARLGEVATAYSKILVTLGVTVHVEEGWGGCEQAKLLIEWIDGEVGAGSCAQVMDEWTAVIWSAIADLAAGKLPT